MVLLLGVDRFMSEARAITNTIGNAVGTMAIAKWVGSRDEDRVQAVLNGAVDPEDLDAIYESEEDTIGEEQDASYQAPQRNPAVGHTSAI
jgi:aerobic C4-dicarboxylate transport protein